MNKQEMRGLPNSSRNISLLKGKFGESRVLWIYPSSKGFEHDPKYILRDYFDLIVVQNRDQLAMSPEPDIFIHWPDDLDSDGTVDQKIFEMKETLFCVNYKAVQQMKKRKWRPSNYILSFKPDFFHPEHTICAAMGAKTNYWSDGTNLLITGQGSVPAEDVITRTSLNEFMGELNKYKYPSNLRTKNRPLIMESWS